LNSGRVQGTVASIRIAPNIGQALLLDLSDWMQPRANANLRAVFSRRRHPLTDEQRRLLRSEIRLVGSWKMRVFV